MMVIAKAPMRISFGGGGTDLPAYYEGHGGLVVSASIRYAFHTLLENAPWDGVQIRAADLGYHSQRARSQDPILVESRQLSSAVVDFFRPGNGLSVLLASEVPMGSGLGVGGALTVSMVKALSFWCGVDLDPATTADIACQIQVHGMGIPVGKQDQHASAFGGINAIEFSSEGVTVQPLNLPSGTEDALEQRLMLFFTGVTQSSSTILHHLRQKVLNSDGETLGRLARIKGVAAEMKIGLERGDLPLFGELLHRSWTEKRQLVEGITTTFIDRCYQAARDQGAKGGTASGAGAGGFLILYCAEEDQGRVTGAMEGLGLQRWRLTLDHTGVELMQATPWQRLGSERRPWHVASYPEKQPCGIL